MKKLDQIKRLVWVFDGIGFISIILSHLDLIPYWTPLICFGFAIAFGMVGFHLLNKELNELNGKVNWILKCKRNQ